MSDVIGSTNPYSNGQRKVLRAVAGLIIPASSEYNIPGADDSAIFERILVMATEAVDYLLPRLVEFEGLARRRHGDDFTALNQGDQTSLLGDSASAGFLRAMIRHTATCYYQDGRVLVSLDLKSTPPFPGGHEVEEGDWSLLDPVKQRAPFYVKV